MNRQQRMPKSCESGSTLLFIIILITVLALIGVGLYTLVMTAQLNQAEAQKSAKAYYLSESCLRIAASEYKHARQTSELEAATAIANLTGSTLTLSSQGSCSITLYPYWFYAPTTMTLPTGSQQLTLYLPGNVPTIEDNGSSTISLIFPSGVEGKLKKRGSSTEVYEFTSATFESFLSGTGTRAVFTLKTPLASVLINAGDEFYLGATYNTPSSSTTLSSGGNLTLILNVNDTVGLTGQMIPPVNGSIFLDVPKLPFIKYEKRIISNTIPKTVTLTNIQRIGSTELPVTISGNSIDIYIGKSMGMKSIASYGN
jgi:Tfp pilus assembly protein PilX